MSSIDPKRSPDPTRECRESHMSLLQKAMLAGASGLLCSVVHRFGFDAVSPEPLYFGASGFLFAAGVLFPYLERDTSVWYRGFGLIVISALSFFCAIQTVMTLTFGKVAPDEGAYVAASLVGAFIVLVGSRYIVPLHRSKELAVTGLTAALIGGLAFYFADVLPDHLHLNYLAFLTWHGVMAIAIHIAENW